MKILLNGNCQTSTIAEYIKLFAPGVVVDITTNTQELLANQTQFINDYDIIFSHDSDTPAEPHDPNLKGDNWSKRLDQATIEKIKYIPYVYFSGFHPDCCYIQRSESILDLVGPNGHYNSSLIFYGWKNNLTVDETCQLFEPDVLNFLNFSKYWSISVKFLEDQFTKHGLELSNLVEKWSQRGCWMYSVNHPRHYVLKDLTQLLLQRENIPITNQDQEIEFDPLESGEQVTIWEPITKMWPYTIDYKNYFTGDLRAYISRHFDYYNNFSRDELRCTRLNLQSFKDLAQYLINRKSTNPYRVLQDYHFWKRAVVEPDVEQVNPAIHKKFYIEKSSKISTAGSCLSQRLSASLLKNGYNFFVTEKNPDHSLELFSARYGNIYTSGQLLQLFDRAFGNFVPQNHYWVNEQGLYVDPFRPEVGGVFDSVDSLLSAQQQHLECVKRMFLETDIFVVTLGLTEAWRNKNDGSIFPIAPGIVAGEVGDQHEFVNFSVVEILNHLNCFVTQLRKVNPKVKIIMTVSPQPPIATYENEHILSAATYTKSALRAAIGEVCKQHDNCDYFPSYEVIVGNFNRSIYFRNDLRTLTQSAVDKIMFMFLNHYSIQQNELMSLLIDESLIVCDEDSIVN